MTDEMTDDTEGKSIEDIWNKKKNIFKNKALVKVSYLPENISDALHRGDVIRKLQNCLLDVSQNLAPNNIIIYGKMGTGKTLISNLVLKDLQTVATKKGIKVTVIEINCEDAKSETGVIGKINNNLLFELSGKLKVSIGNSKTRNNLYFNNYFNELDGILIIILDEIDKIKNPDMINKLARTISTKNGQPPCLIMITNDIYFKENLAGHTKSVLAENEIQFNPYDANQLSDILNARIKKAFYPNVVGEMVVPLCAALSAQEHGDARKAMNLLCKSGEVAENKGKEIIEEEDVREANEILEVDRVIEVVKTLPTQSKLTLYSCIIAIEEGRKNECTIGEVYNLYRFHARELDIDILTQRRITDLVSELDSLGIVNAIVTSQGRYGRSKKISINSRRENIKKTILQDYRLAHLVNIKSTSVFYKMFS